METRDVAIFELQSQSLALADLASDQLVELPGPEVAEDPLPSGQELLDIVLSLLMLEPVPPTPRSDLARR